MDSSRPTHFLTFEDDLELVGHDLEGRDGGPVLRNDVLPVPRAAGELEEVVAGAGRGVHGPQQVRGWNFKRKHLFVACIVLLEKLELGKRTLPRFQTRGSKSVQARE